MKTILVPIDLSEISADVVEEAALIARAFSARLVILHVRPSVPEPKKSAPAGREPGRKHRSKAEDSLTEFQEGLVRQGIPTEVEHLIGPPVEVILKRADQLGADYIVMGSRGHAAIYDLLIGSTAMAVLKRACQPVLFVGSNEIPNAEFIPPLAGKAQPAARVSAAST